MKKSLLALAFLVASGLALAHGPPSALDPGNGIVAMVSSSPSIGGGSGDVLAGSNGGGSGSHVAMHGGGSGGITSISSPAGMGFPPNECMLN